MTALNIPVTKAGNATITVETDQLPERIYVSALTKGLHTLINGGATKLANVKDAKTDEEKAEFAKLATEKAQERVAAMYSNTLKLGREAAVKGPSGAVMTEARRIARDLIKQMIKDSGGKVSHYAASEITKAANELLADPAQERHRVRPHQAPRRPGPRRQDRGSQAQEKGWRPLRRYRRKSRPASQPGCEALSHNPTHG